MESFAISREKCGDVTFHTKRSLREKNPYQGGIVEYINSCNDNLWQDFVS